MLRAAKRVERLTLELEQAREELRQKIAPAHDSGVSISEIARQLGLTRTRIYQLLDRS